MPQAALEITASDPQFASLPFSVEEKSSRSSALILLLLVLPALAILLLPITMLAAVDPAELYAAAARHPAAAAQAVTGLGLWTALLMLPAKRLMQGFGRRRRILIEAGRVIVLEMGAVRPRTWSAPLREFCGVAHRVRATLSGFRHELVLVHPEPGKSLLLHASHHVPQAAVERACVLLGVPEMRAGELPPLQRSADAETAAPAGLVLPRAA